MDISVRAFKARLTHYLRLAQAGEPVVVTFHKKPLVRVIPVESSPNGLPTTVAGVRWSAQVPPYGQRRLTDLPVATGAAQADWILENRR